MCGWTDTEKNERHRVDRNGSRWKEVKKWLNGESGWVTRWVGKQHACMHPSMHMQAGWMSGWMNEEMDG